MTARNHESRDFPVFVRRSISADLPELARLAALSGAAGAPRGVYLIAETHGCVVAAASLQRSEPVLHDPSRDTSDVQELLCRWSLNLRAGLKTIEARAA